MFSGRKEQFFQFFIPNNIFLNIIKLQSAFVQFFKSVSYYKPYRLGK